MMLYRHNVIVTICLAFPRYYSTFQPVPFQFNGLIRSFENAQDLPSAFFFLSFSKHPVVHLFTRSSAVFSTIPLFNYEMLFTNNARQHKWRMCRFLFFSTTFSISFHCELDVCMS